MQVATDAEYRNIVRSFNTATTSNSAKLMETGQFRAMTLCRTESCIIGEWPKSTLVLTITHGGLLRPSWFRIRIRILAG